MVSEWADRRQRRWSVAASNAQSDVRWETSSRSAPRGGGAVDEYDIDALVEATSVVRVTGGAPYAVIGVVIVRQRVGGDEVVVDASK